MTSELKFPHLFAPVILRGKTYRNRIITGPTLFAHAVYIDDIRENVYRMCEKRAAGGAAEVSTGEICVNFEEGICAFINHPIRLVPEGRIDYTKVEGKQFELFKEYADRINRYGAVSLLEFCHEGSQAEAEPPYSPYGPDAYVREDGIQVKAMTKEIMEKICSDFAAAAKFARACGFDGVLIHGGHGFLFQQFVSPLTNHRTDEFGGNMENRARFPEMILDRIRQAVGEDFIIEVRMSAEDGIPGGMTIDDCVEFCKRIDGKCDIIHVSNGLKWKGKETHTFTGSYEAHGYNVQFAEKIKKAVSVSKVAVIGGINSPEYADQIIAEGKADFVVLARQAYADPEFPNKAKNGQERLIRRCVRCFQCYPGSSETEDDPGFPVPPSPAIMGRCSINPETDFSLYPERLPAPEQKRRVLVVGGGVGGMQSAITAAKRGHEVTLCEQSSCLGGTLCFTQYDEDKKDLWNFIATLSEDLKASNVRVLLNTKADRNLMEEYDPDAVIIGIGAEPVIPDIPGSENVLSPLEAYYHPERIGQKVVFIGGGLTGCETALHLAAQGKQVTILGRNVRIAKESFCMPRKALKDELSRRNVQAVTGAVCTSVSENGVYYRKDGRECFEKADTVISALGMRPRETGELKSLCKDRPVWIIGDCNTPGNVGKAVKDGYNAAMAVL